MVPDVTSFTTTNAAKAKIEAMGLVYEEASEYSNTFEKGKIIRQDPLVNTEVPDGSSVKVYVTKIDDTGKSPLILLSRTHYGFVKRLLESEIPELNDGTVI